MIGSVKSILAKQYQHILDNALMGFHFDAGRVKSVSKIVWTCWLQGMDDAPLMVKHCIESQKKALPDYEHRILTLRNYHQWVELPEYIEKKFRKGRIPRALFTDLLRLAVLKKYGGKLPLLSNVKYNEYLKVVAQTAGVDKPITTHWARHTGATMLLNAGVDMETVAKILGHSSTRITRSTYAKLLDDTVAREMEKAEEKER